MHEKDLPPGLIEHLRELVKGRESIPPADRIFQDGREYHECALRCLELRDDHEAFLFKPALVLMGFVVEIYLKGLLTEEGSKVRGHDHSKLFEALDAATRASISERYAERHDGRSLASDLNEYSTYFVQHRYSYELEGEHINDLTGIAQLASSLYEIWTEKRPDLLKAGLVHDRITSMTQGIVLLRD